jgi:hypothetical protein
MQYCLEWLKNKAKNWVRIPMLSSFESKASGIQVWTLTGKHTRSLCVTLDGPQDPISQQTKLSIFTFHYLRDLVQWFDRGNVAIYFLTRVTMKHGVLSYTTACSHVCLRRFAGMYRLHLHGRSVRHESTNKKEAVNRNCFIFYKPWTDPNTNHRCSQACWMAEWGSHPVIMRMDTGLVL